MRARREQDGGLVQWWTVKPARPHCFQTGLLLRALTLASISRMRVYCPGDAVRQAPRWIERDRAGPALLAPGFNRALHRVCSPA